MHRPGRRRAACWGSAYSNGTCRVLHGPELAARCLCSNSYFIVLCVSMGSPGAWWSAFSSACCCACQNRTARWPHIRAFDGLAFDNLVGARLQLPPSGRWTPKGQSQSRQAAPRSSLCSDWARCAGKGQTAALHCAIPRSEGRSPRAACTRLRQFVTQ
jgi:hypothetical protein